MDTSFASLLAFHLEQGTRPGGHPSGPIGDAWTDKKFAVKVGRDPRTVRNWRKGDNTPSKDDLVSVETALFGSAEDNPAYGEWRAELRAAHTRARSVSGSQSAAQPATSSSAHHPCNLPFGTLERLFKGREGVLARLHAALAQEGEPAHAVAVTGRAVHGLGGIGKTRLAIEYAWQHRATHTATLFVPADTPARLDTGLAALAGPDALDLTERATREDAAKAEAVLAWLTRNPGWLLILDNVDDEDALAGVTALLRRLATRGCRGRVLITGRLSTYPHGIGTLELDELDPTAATSYLLDATTLRRPAADDETRARELAEALGGLALGLSQAAAYINANRIGLAGYLGLWRSNQAKVLSWFDRTLVSYDHDVGLAATWATSVERLTPAARGLLERLAFLDPAPVPDSLLDVPSADEEREAEGDDAEDAEGFDGTAALRELFAYSLATRAEPRHEAGAQHGASGVPDHPAFSVHRLVQDYTRRSMDPARRTEALTEALRWVNNAFAEDPTDVRSWPVLDPLAPHALAVTSHGDEAGIPEPTARLMYLLGVLLRAKARWSEAEPLIPRALAICEAHYGPDHPAVATCLDNLAGLLSATGRAREAEPLYRRALAINEAAYEPNHSNVANSLNNLANLLANTGRFGEAEPLVRRNLANNISKYGADHKYVAVALNNLANLLSNTSRTEEADPLYSRALAISEAILGPNHPTVAIRLNNLAGLMYKTGRTEEAEPLIRRALAIREAAYGPEHPSVASCLNNLANLLAETGRTEEAEPLMRRALTIDEASYGPDHPSVTTRLHSLATLLRNTGQAEEADLLMCCVQNTEYLQK